MANKMNNEVFHLKADISPDKITIEDDNMIIEMTTGRIVTTYKR
jgi:hypothetical protein